MKVNNYSADHPHAAVRGWVAGIAAVGTATLSTLQLVVITPTALAADTDNWNPTGLSTADIIRMSSSAAYNLTGIVAPAADRLVILDNIGTFTITLKHDTTSTAANRFLCPGDADLALAADTNVWLQYDFTSSRWRIIGGTGAGSSPIGTPGDAYSLGSLGATATVTYPNGSWQYGTLTDNTAISFAGFTSGKDDGMTLELAEGAGGFTPTFPGATWIGTAPTWDTTAGTTTLLGVLSRDGGSTILIGVIGGNSGGGSSTQHYLIIADSHSSPLVFDDIVQNDSGDGFLYTD